MARNESNEESHLSATLVGMGLGALMGMGFGFTAGAMVFPWGAILLGTVVGTVVGGLLGFWLGTGFTEWLKEHLFWWI
jgi:hypothetical protein